MIENKPIKLLNGLIETLMQQHQRAIAAEVTASVHQLIAKLITEQQRNSETLLKESDVVKMYKVSRSFLRKLRNEEGLPYLKIGDSVRFEKCKLDEFFKKYQVKK